VSTFFADLSSGKGKPSRFPVKPLKSLGFCLSREARWSIKTPCCVRSGRILPSKRIILRFAISSLRKALGETPASPKRIVTIPGRGYSFVGEVRCNPPTAETSSQIAATTAPLPRSRAVYLFIAGALLASLSAYGLIAWLTPNWFSPKALRSVAILPFSVLNPDSKNDYLGLGLTDAVITRPREYAVYRPSFGNCQSIRRPRSHPKRSRS